MSTCRIALPVLAAVTAELIGLAPTVGASEVLRGERLPLSAYGPVVIESMAEVRLRDQQACLDGFSFGGEVLQRSMPRDVHAEEGRSDDSYLVVLPQDNGTLPSIEESFQGTIFGDAGSNSYPPDTMGAIGPEHFVEVLNGNVSVYGKAAPHDRLVNITIASFFAGAGLEGDRIGDPRVLFDHHSGRWIVIATDWESRIYLAFSMTQDPVGDWLKTYFVASQVSWSDFPTLGVDGLGIYISEWTQENSIFAIDKAPLLESEPSLGTVTAFPDVAHQGITQPAHTYGDPGGEYLVSRTGATTLRIRRVNPPLTAPTLTEIGDVVIQAHVVAPTIPALGSLEGLAWDDHRMQMAVYRDGSLWTCHTIGINGRAACRWYQIDPVNHEVQDYGTVSDDTLHYFYPSIMVNQNGDVVMGLSGSSEYQYAAAYYTGRRADDPPGEMAPPALLREGVAPYNLERWGDYSYTTLDPVDELTFWTVQEYAHGEDIWGTWIASFDFDCNDNGIDDHVDVSSGTSLDCNENLMPDECEPDCNGNEIADACDIAAGTSGDCNNNTVPDDCEPDTDCNDNEQQDICEIAAGTAQDCNDNDLPDECDLAFGKSEDCNGNDILDECETDPAVLTFPPNRPADPEHRVRKHRYISVDPNTNCGREVALKVEVAEMKRCSGDLERACKVDEDCEAAVPGSGTCIQHPDVGTAGPWWVQAPQQEQLGCIPGPCGDEDWFARLDAVAHFDVWNLTTLHIGDCETVPVATYEIWACSPPDGAICGDPLTIGTIEQPFVSPGFRGNYGDVVGTVDPVTETFAPPDSFTSVVDVLAYILTRQNYGTVNRPQTHPTWVDLHGLGDGNPPQYILSVSDLGQILKAFAGDAWTDDPGNMNPGQCP